MDKERIGIIEILSASTLYAFIPILVRYAMDLGIYNISFFRIFFTVLLLGVVFITIKKYTITPLKYQISKMFLFGFLHAFIITGYFIAIKYITISTAVLLLYTSSIWMVVFGIILLKEKIRTSNIVALVISFSGVILIISPKQIILGQNLFGNIAALLAGAGFGLVYILSKTFKEYDKVSLTFWQNLLALPFVIPLLFIEPINLTLKNGLIVLLLGIITLIAFIITYRGLEKVKANTASVVILADMLVPIILALLIFKEVPSLYTIFGGILIIIGILIVSSK